MKQAFIEMKCDAPGCGNKVVLPLGRDGQAAFTSKEQLEELDRWVAVQRNDGSTFDYCRQTCHENGAKLLAPVNREPISDMSKLVGADGTPLSREGGSIIP